MIVVVVTTTMHPLHLQCIIVVHFGDGAVDVIICQLPSYLFDVDPLQLLVP